MQFFSVLPRASGWLSGMWWGLILLRGALPALFTVVVAGVVAAVDEGRSLPGPLLAAGAVFVAIQLLAPLHAQVGVTLGERLSRWLHDRLLAATTEPAGLAHLESRALTDRLVSARDFDLGIAGPPMRLSMGIIAGSLVEVVAGVGQAVVLAAYAWWAPLLAGGAWASTHWLLRESSVWGDRDEGRVLEAQRQAEYAYRQAVDFPAAKELRLFGLSEWTVARFAAARRQLVDLRWQATRLRRKPLRRAAVVLVAANGVLLWALARDAVAGELSTGQVVLFAQAAVGVSALAFGGLSWALPPAEHAVAAVLALRDEMALRDDVALRDVGLRDESVREDMTLRDVGLRDKLVREDMALREDVALHEVGLRDELVRDDIALRDDMARRDDMAQRDDIAQRDDAARDEMAVAGGLPVETGEATGMGEAVGRGHAVGTVRFRQVGFTYPGAARPVLDGLDLTIEAGRSLAVVGLNGAGKTTLAKLLCGLYQPTRGVVEAGGVDLRELDPRAWRRRVTAVFQDFIRYELPLRVNVAPLGAPDATIAAALADAGVPATIGLDTLLARGHDGGTDLSGGQWQRVAVARALCAVRQGASVVVLDEPTAQLDVRGEQEIFERILDATRGCTTLLISHRFSTVRHADRICVLEAGRVAESGTHDELMALAGRYRRMFDLQASRFTEQEAVGKPSGKR